MTTLYVREFGFNEALSDAEALDELRFILDELIPAIRRCHGINSVRLFSGAGGIRSQLRLFVDMEDAAGYERLLLNPEIGRFLKRLYAAWDLKDATQDFLREITPEILIAHTGYEN